MQLWRSDISAFSTAALTGIKTSPSPPGKGASDHLWEHIL